MNPINAVSLITGLRGVRLPAIPDAEPSARIPSPSLPEAGASWRLRAAAELPEDPALPALTQIRAGWLAGAFLPGVGEPLVNFLVHSYKPGKRITIEVRA